MAAMMESARVMSRVRLTVELKAVRMEPWMAHRKGRLMGQTREIPMGCARVDGLGLDLAFPRGWQWVRLRGVLLAVYWGRRRDLPMERSMERRMECW